MEKDEHMRVTREWLVKIQAAEKVVDDLKQQMWKDLKRLEADCLVEHGGHQDNGGFMIGCCTRCGAFLG